MMAFKCARECVLMQLSLAHHLRSPRATVLRCTKGSRRTHTHTPGSGALLLSAFLIGQPLQTINPSESTAAWTQLHLQGSDPANPLTRGLVSSTRPAIITPPPPPLAPSSSPGRLGGGGLGGVLVLSSASPPHPVLLALADQRLKSGRAGRGCGGGVTERRA